MRLGIMPSARGNAACFQAERRNEGLDSRVTSPSSSITDLNRKVSAGMQKILLPAGARQHRFSTGGATAEWISCKDRLLAIALLLFFFSTRENSRWRAVWKTAIGVMWLVNFGGHGEYRKAFSTEPTR